MPDEAQTPVDYRALCEAQGWPPIRGGSPELDEQPADAEAPDAAAPQEEGLPASESEPTGEDNPDSTDYRKRFEDLQPQLTRAQEQNAEIRRLIDAARQGDTEALDALGLEYEADDEEDDFLDPDEKLRQEFEELKRERETEKQQRERESLEEQEADYIAEQIDALEKKAGIELDDKAVDFVIDRARADRGADGAPNVEAAFQNFTGVLDSHQERYLASKKQAAKAPAGGPGEEKLDLSDDDARLAAMRREFDAQEGSD